MAYFQSREERCKVPFGAVPCGTAITLTVYDVPEQCRAVLLLRSEFAETQQEIPMTVSATTATVTYKAPDFPELIWYGFRLDFPDGSCQWLNREGHGEHGPRWQQTVYEDTPTPEWFGRGVTYQIFPDRFCRTHIPDPTGMVGDRKIHWDWHEPMDFLPDQHGEIRNRDFYGGNLRGIIEKLPYLQSLGVSTLYLCPIFEADSNHRYNTGNYLAIDPLLGTEADFRALCYDAHQRGMHVMLDGVFNHTGSNSLYFNALGQYPTVGAAQSKDSPYFSWYSFHEFPHRYDAWWGISTLPAVNEQNADYRDFIIHSPDSVIRHWLRCGADAWRLDVADELPDSFIAEIRSVMEQEKPGSFLLGEVWEDGSNKIAYSQRRKYLLGRETHGLMNYPFRVSALEFLCGGRAEQFRDTMETIRENYPPAAFYGAMNLLGTHDTPRILTLLGTAGQSIPSDRTGRANFRLDAESHRRGLNLLLCGSILLYAFPGSPTVFYGDEIGMEGFEDPFNRGTYPWGQENQQLLHHFTRLGHLRRQRISLQKGELRWLYAEGRGLAFLRSYGEEISIAAINAGEQPLYLPLPWGKGLATEALTGQQFLPHNGTVEICLPPYEGMLLV